MEEAFREVGARRAAAVLRGVGDEHFEIRSRADRKCHSFCRGKDLRRNRLRAHADIRACHSVAGVYRGGSRACDALVADGLHRDYGSTNFIAAGYRFFGPISISLFAACPGRAYAA